LSLSGYDNANRLLSVTHSKGGSTLASAGYTLDADGSCVANTALSASLS